MFAGFADSEGDEAGVILSGGQWQRVALSRSVLRRDAELVILDEPSSGLDPRAEADIHHRTMAYREGRTSLLVSHRLNAVRLADHIAVLDGGRVTEYGSHAELLAAGGLYAELFRQQAAGYRDAPEDERPGGDDASGEGAHDLPHPIMAPSGEEPCS